MHKKNRWSELKVKEVKKNLAKPKHSLAFRLKNHHQFNKIVFAICSSLLIGLTFGFIILNMLKQEDPEQASILNATTANKQEKQINGDTSPFEAVEFFVVQSGVFSEQQNALNWAESFKKKQVPVVVWEREGNYYLFAGVFQSEASAKSFADQMDELGLDAYVKQWNTKEGQLALNKADHAVIQSFLKTWKESLQSVEKDGSLAQEGWDHLLNMQVKELDDFISTVTKELEQQGNERENRYILLKLMTEFEQLLES